MIVRVCTRSIGKSLVSLRCTSGETSRISRREEERDVMASKFAVESVLDHHEDGKEFHSVNVFTSGRAGIGPRVCIFGAT